MFCKRLFNEAVLATVEAIAITEVAIHSEIMPAIATKDVEHDP